jgi:Domain of unknown function (DUF4252)
MKVERYQLALWAAAALVALAAGAPRAYGQEPARLHISGLEKLAAKASETVDVNLDGPMLRLASKFINDDENEKDDAALRQMLQNLQGIYVKSFEFDKEGEYSPADVEAIRSQLHAPAWSKIVSVRSKKDGENTEVYLLGTESNVRGLAIIAAEPKELTVVNLVGPIDLSKLSELGGHMGVPKIKLEKKSGAKPEAKADEEKP